MHQIIEMKINRLYKEIDGLSGKTENVGASERWGKIHHDMAAMREQLNETIRKNAKHVNTEPGGLTLILGGGGGGNFTPIGFPLITQKR